MANLTSAQQGRGVGLAEPLAGPQVDYATLAGTLGAFVVIGLAMYLGGRPDSFIDIPAMLIVLCGSFLVTTISFSWDEVVQAQGLMLRASVYHVEELDEAARQAMRLAGHARRDGVLSLQKIGAHLSHSAFLERAVSIVVDGAAPDDVERIMQGELQATERRHARSVGVLRRAGEVAPAMGLIGTLVGLVQMLGNLEEPSSIGPAMAVALLTTFYGAVLANMVFLPLAKKLERNSERESLVNQIYAACAVSICRKENPRRLEMLLNTILPPDRRLNLFD